MQQQKVDNMDSNDANRNDSKIFNKYFQNECQIKDNNNHTNNNRYCDNAIPSYNNDGNDKTNSKNLYDSNKRQPESTSWKQQHSDNKSHANNSYRTDKKWDRSLNERTGSQGFERSNNNHRKRNFIDTNSSTTNEFAVQTFPSTRSSPSQSQHKQNDYHKQEHQNSGHRPYSKHHSKYNQKSNNNNDHQAQAMDSHNNEELNANTHAEVKHEKNYNCEDEIDPFPSALRCSNYCFSNRLLSNVEQHQRQQVRQQTHEQRLSVLEWYSPRDAIPIENEHTMINVLLQYGSNERGMFKDQPVHRLEKIKQILSSSRTANNRNNNTNRKKTEIKLNLIQALSLRRHYMKLYNPFLSMTQLRLGTEKQINGSAKLFENAIEQFLRTNSILYYNERIQKQHIANNKPYNEPYPPTPDFVFIHPIKIRTFRYKVDEDEEHGTTTSSSRNSHQHPSRRHREKVILQEYVVSWMEVKMFYGASTIPSDNKSAVGCILPTATKYVKCHGPGAMIFAYGFGTQLEQQLLDVGVIALDCNYGYCHHSDKTIGKNTNDDVNNNVVFVDLEPVMSHQRTWCANVDGEILP